jgi:hypothetical protein
LEEYEAQQSEKKAALAKYTNKGKTRTIQAAAGSALHKGDEEFWADQKRRQTCAPAALPHCRSHGLADD